MLRLDYLTNGVTFLYKKRGKAKVNVVVDPFREVQDPEIYKLLGRAHPESSNSSKAIEFFTKALAAGGEIVEILNLLGYSHYKNNDLMSARKYLERSLKLNQNQPEIKRLIEEI